jgi:hypothetical protein
MQATRHSTAVHWVLRHKRAQQATEHRAASATALLAACCVSLRHSVHASTVLHLALRHRRRKVKDAS